MMLRLIRADTLQERRPSAELYAEADDLLVEAQHWREHAAALEMASKRQRELGDAALAWELETSARDEERRKAGMQ